MKHIETEASLYCHPSSRTTKGRRMLVRKKVLFFQQINVRSFSVIPESCPAGLKVSCSACEHSYNRFDMNKRPDSDSSAHGVVKCAFNATGA